MKNERDFMVFLVFVFIFSVLNLVDKIRYLVGKMLRID